MLECWTPPLTPPPPPFKIQTSLGEDGIDVISIEIVAFKNISPFGITLVKPILQIRVTAKLVVKVSKGDKTS